MRSPVECATDNTQTYEFDRPSETRGGTGHPRHPPAGGKLTHYPKCRIRPILFIACCVIRESTWKFPWRQKHRGETGKWRCATAKILVVEDDEPLRSLYKYELEEEGYEVVIAVDGKTALRSLEHSSVDLIILDMVMPEMDGLETLKMIASRQKKIPVIIHTAYSQHNGQTLPGLADACLTKSSDLSLLKGTVKELLETYRTREP